MRTCTPYSLLIAGTAVALVSTTLSEAHAGRYLDRVATLPVFLNLPAGIPAESETVAEIVAADANGELLAYTDGPGQRIGFVDITDLEAPVPAGIVDVTGEPTSITIVGNAALAAVNTSPDHVEPSGHLAIIDIVSREVIARCDLGGQPDSVAASPDGAFLAVAIENERDEDLNDGIIPQLPAGHLALLDLDGNGVPTNCDAPRMIDLTGLAEVAPEDPEPEFVDINNDNIAVITLQENNHIALVDLAGGSIVGHFSAGTADVYGIDTKTDRQVRADGRVVGIAREPDAVAWLDDDRLVTANEGDYEGGSRGFTIFSKTGEVLYDSGNLIEHLGVLHGHYPEHRAGKKGTEPEGVDVGTLGGERLIFVGSERGNFVAVFADAGAGQTPELLQFLPTAVGPEGILALPQRNALVVASEVDSEEDGIRSTIAIYAHDANMPAYPQIVSTSDSRSGLPIGWGAMSGLAADPMDPRRLYAVSDSAYARSAIYEIELGTGPARIVAAHGLMKDGEPANYDLEGIAVAADGGFWLASEGNPDSDNPQQQRSQLVKVTADGTVEREVFLPEEVYGQAIRFGFEGVATWGEDRLVVAFQRAWKDDADDQAKLGIHDIANDSWSFVRYPLEAPKSERGGWVGLSEITALGGDRFAIIERDNQPGSYAVIKTVTTVSLEGVEPAAFGEEIPVMEKSVAIDVLPAMQSGRGWISDKPEGLAVTADDRVFLITDNDGVDDATGETQLIELGRAADLF